MYHGESHIAQAAIIGGVTGGLLAGAGTGISAGLRTAAGRALASRVAASTIGQGVGAGARSAGQSIGVRGARRSARQAVVGGGGSRAAGLLREPAERLGQRISVATGIGPGARLAAAAEARAAATQMNVLGTGGATRTVTSAAEGQTFTHSVGWRGGGPLGPGVTGAQVEA